jgi:DNA-damage-inducible protein J
VHGAHCLRRSSHSAHRTANEGARPLELIGNAAARDAWFRSKVQEVIDDKRPDIAHEDVEARFTARHEGSLRTSGKECL